MLQRTMAAMLVLVILVACEGGSGQQALVIQTAEVTRIVTKVVIVTVTPPPASPTPKASPTPNSPPTATPDTRVLATATRDASIYATPDEKVKALGALTNGESVEVLYSGGQWFQVKKADGATGWAFRDWLSIPDDQLANIGIYPDALVVFSGNVVQDYSSNYVTFAGRVINIGLEPACGVKVQFDLLDAAGGRVGFIEALVDGIDVEAGDEQSYRALGEEPATWQSYVSGIDWSDC